MKGEWWVEPLPRRGYARRPHFYPTGSTVSFCLIGHRTKRDLQFDPDTGMTVTADPRLGEPQFRRACGACTHDLAATEARLTEHGP